MESSCSVSLPSSSLWLCHIHLCGGGFCFTWDTWQVSLGGMENEGLPIPVGHRYPAPPPWATPRSTSPPSGHRALTGWRCGPPAQGVRCCFPRCRGWAPGGFTFRSTPVVYRSGYLSLACGPFSFLLIIQLKPVGSRLGPGLHQAPGEIGPDKLTAQRNGLKPLAWGLCLTLEPVPKVSSFSRH